MNQELPQHNEFMPIDKQNADEIPSDYIPGFDDGEEPLKPEEDNGEPTE